MPVPRGRIDGVDLRRARPKYIYMTLAGSFPPFFCIFLCVFFAAAVSSFQDDSLACRLKCLLPQYATMSQVHSSASSATATEPAERDVESQKRNNQQKASHWSLVFDQTHVTPEVVNWPYKGKGTEEDPYVVEYIENDRRNPMLWSQLKKWTITILVAMICSTPPL